MSSAQISRCIAALGALAIAAYAIQISSGQQPSQANLGETSNRSSASEAAAIEAILASAQWNQAYDQFQKWLASQTIYTPAEIERVTSNLLTQIKSASASELQGILDDWQARLKVLNGKDTQDAQQWLGEYLSVFADGFRRRRLQELGLTNIENMNADQLEDAIVRIRAHRLGLQQRRAAFDETRQQQVQRVQQANASARQARLEARSGGAQFNTHQSPYRPPRFDPPPPPRRQFFVGPDGRIAFMLPF